MSTTPVQIRPPYNQQDFFDPKTGKLTEDGWWFLHDLQQGAQGAIDNSHLDTVDLTPVGGVVIPDLSQSGPLGSFHLSSRTVVAIGIPIFTGRSVPSGARIVIWFDQDSGGGNPAPLFSTAPGGWLDEINQIAIIKTANTRTTYEFGYDGQVWTLIAFQTGQQTLPT